MDKTRREYKAVGKSLNSWCYFDTFLGEDHVRIQNEIGGNRLDVLLGTFTF